MLPEQAWQALSDALEQRGFARKAMLRDYSFTSSGGYTRIAGMMFADPDRRTPADYAAATVYNLNHDQQFRNVIHTLSQASAPLHFLHHEESQQYSFSASNIKNGDVDTIPVFQNIGYDQLNAVLQDFATDLTPERIVAVKQGREQFSHPFLRQIAPLQLSLWATEVTRPLLVQHFGQAIANLRIQTQANANESDVINIAVQMLGALVLADTGVLGEEIRRRESEVPLSQLIQAAWSTYPTYFTRSIFERYMEIAEQAYTTLRQIRYAGFVPDMLEDLYTAAYNRKERKLLGRFDTPLYLTRRIWQTIPVEFLRPEQRTTIDMTCGWGSFLIAGWERLAQLRDMRGLQLRDYIRGNDKDELTARLAGLGLLLSTSSDSWQINHEDALSWDWLREHQPEIIVGNPPFSGSRNRLRTSDELMPEQIRKREELANTFVDLAVKRLAPNGFLAMVLPHSFLISEAGPQVRRSLLERCDITEIWQLPNEVFPDAMLQPIVLFARKHAQPGRVAFPVRIRNIQKDSKKNPRKDTLSAFKRDGTVTASNLAIDQSQWNTESSMKPTSANTHLITPTVILSTQEWKQIQTRCDPLEKLATIFPGITRGGNRSNNRRIGHPIGTEISYLTNAHQVVPEPWQVNYSNTLKATYPDDFIRPRIKFQKLLAGPKVLLVANPNPSWGLRSKAAIERRGYFVTHSFWVIVSDNMSLPQEVIAAILNWHVCNAWIVDNLNYTWIKRRVLDLVPVPKLLTNQHIKDITTAVIALENAANLNELDKTGAQEKIDVILTAAYSLDESTLARLKTISAWNTKVLRTFDPQPNRTLANYITSGVVEEVNAANNTITLWMNGFDELQTVQIDAAMPGWMLRTDVAFRVKIPYECERKHDLVGVIWNGIEPQQYTYLDDQELFNELGHIFNPDGADTYDVAADRENRFS